MDTLKDTLGNLDPERPAKVLLFTTEPLVMPHYAANAFLAETLLDDGHEVVTTTCRGGLTSCIGMDSVFLTYDDPKRPSFCQQCSAVGCKVTQHLALPTVDLSDLITSVVADEVRSVIASHQGHDSNLIYDNVNFGTVAFSATSYTFKKFDPTTLNPAEELHLRHQLDSCLSIYIALKHYLREHNFTHVFAYGQYGINLAACLAAEHSNLRWNLLQHIPHNGVDRQRLFVQQQATTRSRYRNINSEWWDYRDNTFTANDLAESVGDVLARMSSRNPLVYSPTKSASSDVLNELNISANQKVIVAFTSSLDEQIAQDQLDQVIPPSVPRHKPPEQYYQTQLEWLAELKDIAAEHPDWVIVIRIHPREDSNAREKARSQHLESLEKLFSDYPENMRIVWPKDTISSYDLAEVADKILTSFSNISLECARVGVPVATYCNDVSAHPTNDFIKFYQTKEELIEFLESVPSPQATTDQILYSLRYYAFRSFYNSLDFRDTVPESNYGSLIQYRRTSQSTTHVSTLLTDRSPVTFASFPETTPSNQAAELEALRSQLARILTYLMFGLDSKLNVEWHVVTSRPPREREVFQRPTLFIDGRFCDAIIGNHRIKKISPAVARASQPHINYSTQAFRF